MDRIENDPSTSFVALGEWSYRIAAIYGPHVTGRMIATDTKGRRLTQESITEIRSGSRPIVAVFGPPDDVGRMIETFPLDLGVGTELLDTTHQSALGLRLVVYAMPESQTFPIMWRAGSLPVMSGTVVDHAVRVSGRDSTGFVTYGPYVELPAGRYTATLRYSSSARGAVVGGFDVSSPEAGPGPRVELTGTDGEVAEVEISFVVVDDEAQWEFRSSWNGVADLVVEGIRIDTSP